MENVSDWWRDDSWSREEWDVALDCGKDRQALYRIYRELSSGTGLLKEITIESFPSERRYVLQRSK